MGYNLLSMLATNIPEYKQYIWLRSWLFLKKTLNHDIKQHQNSF
ncbi:MAG: hypothetical protein ACFCAD_11495 [Pleurocapsa sp.]